MTLSLISSDTAVQAALRLRPLIAEELAAFGVTPWDTPYARIADLFGRGEGLSRFLERVSALPIPAPESPWRDLSAAHLIDYLTQHHRVFFHVTLPDVEGLFRDWDSQDPEIVEAREDFEDFGRSLRAEVAGEETHFFPRVLRYEACLANPAVDPEFNGGSLRLGIAYRQSHSTGLNPDRLDRLTGRLRETYSVRNGDTWAEMALERIEDFTEQFKEHERLEADVLYPMALEMETALYDLSIAGTRAGAVPVA
jgi:hypothetical protein